MPKIRNDAPLYKVWRQGDDEADDAREYQALDVRFAARAHAAYGHGHRDWWECTWPIVMRVFDPTDGVTYAVSVEREMVPEFSSGTPQSLDPAAFPAALHVIDGGSQVMCHDVRLEGIATRDWPAGHHAIPFDKVTDEKMADGACEPCVKAYKRRLEFMADVAKRRKELEAERAKKETGNG